MKEYVITYRYSPCADEFIVKMTKVYATSKREAYANFLVNLFDDKERISCISIVLNDWDD